MAPTATQPQAPSVESSSASLRRKYPPLTYANTPCSQRDNLRMFCSTKEQDVIAARQLCGGCPFRVPCLVRAIVDGDSDVVRGGVLFGPRGPRGATRQTVWGYILQSVTGRKPSKSDLSSKGAFLAALDAAS